MKLLGIRYCSVSAEAEKLAQFFDALGIRRRPIGDVDGQETKFAGAIFPAGDSWVEMWPAGQGMPAGTMLQLVVDDADSFAATARANGLAPQGPQDAHGERIYFLQAPNGLQLTFQSALPAAEPQDRSSKNNDGI